MMKWIRWQGVIAFAVVTGLIGAVWYFYIDRWVENYIERWGTLAVGAKVDLDGADVTFLPLGVELSRLQVTNPGEPMENAVEVKRIAFNLEAPQLLLHKTIINEMVMDGMVFGTPRKYSGEAKRDINTVIPKAVTDYVAKEMGPVEVPDVEVPDVMQILKQEDLASVRLVETVQKEIDEQRAAWEKRIKELPNKKTFEEYKARVEKVKKASKKSAVSGALKAAADVSRLPQEIQRELDKLKSAKEEMENTLELVKTRIGEAQKAPFEDIERLKDKYNLSGKGLTNLTRTFLGPQYADNLSKLFYWHGKVAPYLEKKEEDPKEKKPERGKGIDVRFKDHHPLPEFLVKVSRVTLAVDEVGSFKGEIRNITGDQPVWGQPLTVKLEGDKLETVIKRAALDMEFNRVRPAEAKDIFQLSADGFEIREKALSKDDRWPITLKEANASAKVKIEFVRDAVNGLIFAGMKPVKIVTGFDSMQKNPVARAISGALGDIDQFNIEAEVHGKPENYDLILRSNLDEILQNALNRIIQELVVEFEKRLKAEIMKRVEKPLAEMNAKVKNLTGMDLQLQDLSKDGEKLLKDALEGSVGGALGDKLPGGVKVPKLFGR